MHLLCDAGKIFDEGLTVTPCFIYLNGRSVVFDILGVELEIQCPVLVEMFEVISFLSGCEISCVACRLFCQFPSVEI